MPSLGCSPLDVHGIVCAFTAKAESDPRICIPQSRVISTSYSRLQNLKAAGPCTGNYLHLLKCGHMVETEDPGHCARNCKQPHKQVAVSKAEGEYFCNKCVWKEALACLIKWEDKLRRDLAAQADFYSEVGGEMEREAMHHTMRAYYYGMMTEFKQITSLSGKLLGDFVEDKDVLGLEEAFRTVDLGKVTVPQADAYGDAPDDSDFVMGEDDNDEEDPTLFLVSGKES